VPLEVVLAPLALDIRTAAEEEGDVSTWYKYVKQNKGWLPGAHYGRETGKSWQDGREAQPEICMSPTTLLWKAFEAL